MRFFAYKILYLLLFLQTAGFAEALEPITIALIGPMSGSNAEFGSRMARSVTFQINQFNKKSGLKPIRLAIFDDEGSTKKSLEIAKKIKSQNISLIITELPFDSAGLVSDIYKTLEMPIISPSILQEEINNPWLFRTLYDTHSLGVFLANYMKKIIGFNSVNVIYLDDAYGNALANDFSLPFRGVDGVVKNIWKIRKKNLDEDVSNISKLLLAEQYNPADALFFATDGNTAAELITFIKRKGLSYKIFGTEKLADREFISQLSASAEEEYNPGYLSDGISGALPIILDIGNEQAQIFDQHYSAFYQQDPTWVEASFYDSSFLATKAISEALKKNNNSIKDFRNNVKEYLLSLNEQKDAIDGLTGPIYFDRFQKRIPQIVIGEYFNQKLNSAYTQLYPISNEILDFKSDESEILTINSQYLQKMNIVFTDIDIIEVSDLDLKTSDYVINFYLSFRYRGDIDAKNIEFINQAEPIVLGTPLEKVTEHGITQESYRIEARFNGNFNFANYPFDTQELILQFQNKKGFESNIIYVRDEISMSFETLADDLKQIQKSKTLEDWTATNIIFYQDNVQHFSTFGDPRLFNFNKKIEYSKFNVKITIKRNSLSFAAKNFLPIIIIFLLIYLVTFTDFTTAISVYVGAILATIVEHVRISGELPGIGYTITLDYIFYIVYIIIVIQITLSIIAENKRLNNKEVTSEKIILVNKIAFPIFALAIIGFYIYSSFWTTPHVPMKKVITHKEIMAKNTNRSVLTLSSWHSDNEASFEKILSAFNAHQNDFEVQFAPIRYAQYNETLLTQLNTSTEPDLFYLPGNEIDSQYFIKNGFTYPLTDFVTNHELTTQEKHNWTYKGVLHAAPIQAISQGVYYNKDIFRRLNLAIPKTWEEFLLTAKKLKSAGITPLANGSKEAWANAEIIFMSLAPNYIGGTKGRELFEQGKRCFDDASVKEIFEAIKALIPFIPSTHRKLSSYDSRELFIEQKAAMWIGGSWELTFFSTEKLPFSMSIFALPAPKNMKTTVIFHYDSAIAINSKSDQKERALKFLQWTQTPEFSRMLQDNLPGYFSLTPKTPLPKDIWAKEFLHLARTNPTDSRFILPAGVPSSYQLMAKASSEVLNEKITPEAAARFLQEGLATWFRPAQLCR